MSKILYDLQNGKVKELSNSDYDSATNTLSVQGLSSSVVNLNLENGIVFSNNKILSSSIGSNGQIICWDADNTKWSFRDFRNLSTDTTEIPNNSDITGSFLNCQIKSLSNVVSGVLPISRGGTGLTTSDFNSLNSEAILISDGSSKLAFKQASADITKPSIVASFTASSNVDQTDTQNAIVLINGVISDASTPIFGSTKALSSSYNANSANYTGYIGFDEGHYGDFTAECWTYLSNIGGTPYDVSRSTIIVTNNVFAVNTGGPAQFGTSGFYCIYTSNGDYYTNLAFIPNQWVHIALTRSGNKLKVYANATGSQEFEITNPNLTELNKIYIGGNDNGIWNINGFITDFCFTKYAKTDAELITYYNAVLNGTQSRHSKDEQNLSATSRLQSQMSIDDSTVTKTNVVQSRLVGILTSTGIFNHYY